MNIFNSTISRFRTSVLAIAIILGAGIAQAESAESAPDMVDNTLQKIIDATSHFDRDQKIQNILAYAHTFRGVRYRYGSAGPSSFDCSGFTSYVYRNFGYELNRSAYSQINDGTIVDRKSLQPGDLVFFSGRGGGARIGHVGIVVDTDEGGFSFIHASVHKGITVSHSTESYYAPRYRGACRVVE